MGKCFTPSEDVSRVPVRERSNSKDAPRSSVQIADNRPGTLVQRKLQTMANNASNTGQVMQLHAIVADFTSVTLQKKEPEERELQMKAAPLQKKENNTGLPDNLKNGIEDLSGYAMDDVRVHYNSDQPAQLNAHAYAQGTDIHLASGQERHLPHEAWHVVQQKQSRVKPTMQLMGKVNINDEAGLEKEADVMGAAAMRIRISDKSMFKRGDEGNDNRLPKQFKKSGFSKNSIINHSKVVQRLVGNKLKKGDVVYIQRSTEQELHNAKAHIISKAKKLNSYLVQVESGGRKTLRYDQLSRKPSAAQENPPLNVDIEEITNRNSQELLHDATGIVTNALKLEAGQFVFGGSFAVLIHAFEQGVSARTPRDVDVIVGHKEFMELKQKYVLQQSGDYDEFRTGHELWGIPIEIHLDGTKGPDFMVSDLEKETALEGKNKLFSAYLSRIQSSFSDQVTRAKKMGSAKEVLASLERSNKRALKSKKGDNKSRVMWIKTLADIRHLVNAGAAYEPMHNIPTELTPYQEGDPLPQREQEGDSIDATLEQLLGQMTLIQEASEHEETEEISEELERLPDESDADYQERVAQYNISLFNLG